MYIFSVLFFSVYLDQNLGKMTFSQNSPLIWLLTTKQNSFFEIKGQASLEASSLSICVWVAQSKNQLPDNPNWLNFNSLIYIGIFIFISTAKELQVRNYNVNHPVLYLLLNPDSDYWNYNTFCALGMVWKLARVILVEQRWIIIFKSQQKCKLYFSWMEIPPKTLNLMAKLK